MNYNMYVTNQPAAAISQYPDFCSDGVLAFHESEEWKVSERERVYQLLDTVPDNKISYLIGYIQGLTVENEETPNAVTLAAFKEGDEMLAAGTGRQYTNTAELFADLED